MCVCVRSDHFCSVALPLIGVHHAVRASRRSTSPMCLGRITLLCASSSLLTPNGPFYPFYLLSTFTGLSQPVGSRQEGCTLMWPLRPLTHRQRTTPCHTMKSSCTATASVFTTFDLLSHRRTVVGAMRQERSTHCQCLLREAAERQQQVPPPSPVPVAPAQPEPPGCPLFLLS